MIDIKRLLPEPILGTFRKMKYGLLLFRCYFYDMRRTWKWTSSISAGKDKGRMQALVIMGYHSIEKGLSLRHPRPGFGQENIEVLIGRIREYIQLFGFDRCTQIALDSLKSYSEFNLSHGLDMTDLQNRIAELDRDADPARSPALGGTKRMTKEDLFRMSKIELKPFLESRSSVRDFSPEDVSLSEIEEAVRLAQRTPSVCNRQSTVFWVLSRRELIDECLEIQGGARGFSEQAKKLIVVTSNLSHFQSPLERNQCYIDGGMAGMTLIYTLHSLGLVTCPLVWSADSGKDRKLKKLLGMHDSYTVIMLLALGRPRDEYSVAQSTRKPLEEALVVCT